LYPLGFLEVKYRTIITGCPAVLAVSGQPQCTDTCFSASQSASRIGGEKQRSARRIRRNLESNPRLTSAATRNKGHGEGDEQQVARSEPISHKPAGTVPAAVHGASERSMIWHMEVYAGRFPREVWVGRPGITVNNRFKVRQHPPATQGPFPGTGTATGSFQPRTAGAGHFRVCGDRESQQRRGRSASL